MIVMKKIIKNRLYDTDTAKVIGEYVYSNRRDFSFYEETLYKKKNGEYFLHGIGGGLSKYAESTGTNTWGGGEKIMPLTTDRAQEWAEQHLDTDEYIKEFGKVEEQTETSSKIKKIRQMTGYSQEEFSKKYNIPTRTLNSWELEERTPPAYVVELLEFKVKKDLEK